MPFKSAAKNLTSRTDAVRTWVKINVVRDAQQCAVRSVPDLSPEADSVKETTVTWCTVDEGCGHEYYANVTSREYRDPLVAVTRIALCISGLGTWRGLAFLVIRKY